MQFCKYIDRSKEMCKYLYIVKITRNMNIYIFEITIIICNFVNT